MKYNKKGYSWITKIEDIIANGCKIMPSIYTGVHEEKIDIVAVENEINELKLKLSHQIELSNRISKLVFEELNK